MPCHQIKFIKKLSGHSGCDIKLYRDGNLLFVRKKSGTENYNNRLKIQCHKQNNFQFDGIYTPKVMRDGFENGLYYFDMEYVKGISLAEYMRKIPVREISYLIELLFSFLTTASPLENNTAHSIFMNKILSVEKNLVLSTDISTALGQLRAYDFSNIPHSFCCGDLTLENIIISTDGSLYLIDFLDSFYDSWMMDIAKMLQDLELGWSYRYTTNDFSLKLRLFIARKYLIDNIISMQNGSSYLISTYHILLLNTLRIFPYTKDGKTFEFLNKSIKKILTIINGLE